MTAVIPPDGQLPEENVFRLASLRYFLRVYRSLRPEVVSELQARVIPPYRESCLAHMEGTPDASRKATAFQEALEMWILHFGLPNTFDMKVEAIRTLLTPSPSGRLVFWWDSALEIVKSAVEETSPGGDPSERVYSHPHPPFTFSAVGWTPSKESIDQARRRLRKEFERALSEHIEPWRSAERAGGDLDALLKREPIHARHLSWLAFKQACPNLALLEIKARFKCSIDSVRRGIHSAADCLGLPRESIREARRGRKPHPRSV